jgi:hypothetical protein
VTFGRRRRRPDDWSTNHVRARAALSDRLDGLLEPSEASWLEEHLAGCPECGGAAEDYAAQRLQLRAGRDHVPEPPRDLWARTAAAIEHEARFRDRRSRAGGTRRRAFALSPALVTALVVTVVAGTLISSRLLVGDGHATPAASPFVASANAGSASGQPQATPILVAQHVQYVSKDQDGRYRVTKLDVRSVCPEPTDTCDTAAPVVDQQVELTTTPQTVFGNKDQTQLIVVSEADQRQAASISVVPIPSSAAGGQPPPSASPSPTATATTAATAIASPVPPSAPPSATPSTAASTSPSVTPAPTSSTAAPPVEPSAAPPTILVTPSPTPGGAIKIAEDVVLVGQSAAYSPSGTWFAFTARPADGSRGPDIYVWRVGEATARAVTTDHRSAFGSWLDDATAVGSSVRETTGATAGATPIEIDAGSFLIDPRSGAQTALPQAGRAWRPSVNPTAHRAVYWAGSLRLKDGAPVYLPDAGRLVIGDWDVPTPTSSDRPTATPLSGDQRALRHETTIAAGRMEDWDARWDATGTKLALWIANAQNPQVGYLSLYDVDPFDGRIDLKKPLLDKQPATAGFSISDGKLVWAEPAADHSGTGGRILVLAWTDHGAGTVETVPDQVYVIR